MLSVKATPVNLRLPMQWQREIRMGSLLQEMRLRPQRQEDRVLYLCHLDTSFFFAFWFTSWGSSTLSSTSRSHERNFSIKESEPNPASRLRELGREGVE
jgi:hypothetical protein